MPSTLAAQPHPDSTMDPEQIRIAYTDLLAALAAHEPRALARVAKKMEEDAERVSGGRIGSLGGTLARTWLAFAGTPLVTEDEAREAAGGLFTGVVGELVEKRGDTYVFAYSPEPRWDESFGPEDTITIVAQPIDRGERVRIGMVTSAGETWIASPKVKR